MPNQQLSFAHPSEKRGSAILINLMEDTDASVLAMLSGKYGLKRVPGLKKQAIIDRLLRYLSDESRARLQNEMIAARYGELPIEKLLNLAMDEDYGAGRVPRAKVDEMKPNEAALIESGPRRWVYTMHGHDVTVDLNQRALGCNCQFFAFASRRQALCKHLALAFNLIPAAYAREALVDLIVIRKFGGKRAGQWLFEGSRAA